MIFYGIQLLVVLVYKARWWMENKEAILPGNEIPIHKNIAMNITILNIMRHHNTCILHSNDSKKSTLWC